VSGCQDSRDLLLRGLCEAFQRSDSVECPSNIRVLITSRPYLEIKEELQQFSNKDLASFDMSKQDVEAFIQKRVAELRQKKKYTSLHFDLPNLAPTSTVS
jgi:hypothetical protein